MCEWICRINTSKWNCPVKGCMHLKFWWMLPHSPSWNYISFAFPQKWIGNACSPTQHGITLFWSLLIWCLFEVLICSLSLMVKSHLCFLSNELPVVLLILFLYGCACFPSTFPCSTLGPSWAPPSSLAPQLKEKAQWTRMRIHILVLIPTCCVTWLNRLSHSFPLCKVRMLVQQQGLLDRWDNQCKKCFINCRKLYKHNTTLIFT